MSIPTLRLGEVASMAIHRISPCARTLALLRLPRSYHAEGAFLARDGRRFDVAFADLLKDPALPARCFPTISELERTLEARFIRRASRHRCSAWNWDSYP
jgi:hypothetical protein